MAAPQTFSAGVDALFTTTLQLVRKRLADNIFKQNPLTFWLLARGRVKVESGGYDIREPLIYQTNPTVLAYNGYDRLNVTPSDELTMAIFAWKLKAATVSISGEEGEVKNAGAQALFNLLQAKINIAEKTMREELNADLFRTTDIKSSKEILGLDSIIERTTTFGTVGGIDSNTHSWWRNQDTTGNLTDIYAEFNTMYNDVHKGGRRVDLILVPQTTYERFENEAIVQGAQSTVGVVTNGIGAPLVRAPMDGGALNVGFPNIRYKGATIMWDEMHEDTTIRAKTNSTKWSYFIDTDSISMTIHRNRNFVMRPFQVPYDQDARVAQILWAGNLTTNNRRSLGVLQLT